MSTSAERRAFREMPETCSDLEGIMDEATKRIKSEITEVFRRALVTAYEEVERVESERDDKQNMIDDLDKQEFRLEEDVESLKDEVTRLENEVNRLKEQLGET